MRLIERLKLYLDSRTKEQLEADHKEILENIKGVQGPLATDYINSLMDIKRKESSNFHNPTKPLK